MRKCLTNLLHQYLTTATAGDGLGINNHIINTLLPPNPAAVNSIIDWHMTAPEKQDTFPAGQQTGEHHYRLDSGVCIFNPGISQVRVGNKGKSALIPAICGENS